MTTGTSQGTKSQLFTLVSVFFFFGFLASFTSILIPFCKKHFQLSQFVSQYIEPAFYSAYFIGALIMYVSTQLTGVDLLNKIGYKKGIIYGLLISAVGAFSVVLSAKADSFPLILLSFFIISLGFSLQQTAANPFVIAIGNPATGAHRLTLAGSINSFGGLIGPLILSYALYGSLVGNAEADIESINTTFLILGVVFLAVALFFSITKLPNVTNNESFEKGAGALKYPQLVLGMVGIFIYVGVEATVASNMGALLKDPDFLGLSESENGIYISLYWGSMMIGRWTGALSVFNFTKATQTVLTIVTPFVAFGIYLLVNSITGKDISHLYSYAFWIIPLILIFFVSKNKPSATLMLLSIFGVIAMAIGVLGSGKVALFAIISAGLCCSIMWPCIFSMATAGLGKYTSQGSAFLIMMILGGGVVPLIQGFLVDKIGSQFSYIVPGLGFVYLAFHAFKSKQILKLQGINYEQAVSGGH